MTIFYVNKFMVVIEYDKDQSPKIFFPAGNIFTVERIDYDMIRLKPVKKDAPFSFYMVSPLMLQFAFDETESID